jgi:hypothetical protein
MSRYSPALLMKNYLVDHAGDDMQAAKNKNKT